MNDLIEIRKKAQNLRNQKKYSEALPLYKELWNNYESKDKWDGWGYALCLNQLKDYSTAYKVCREVLRIDPAFDYIKSQFAWAAFMKNIKDYPDDSPTEILENYVSDVITVTEGKEQELFRNQAILKLLDHLSFKNSWGKVIEWAKFINPEHLNTEPFSGVSNDGKKFRKPSDIESYYLKLSKALEKDGKFTECIDLCNTAIKIFPDIIWFKWHKGSCLRKIKKFQEAISLLEDVKKIKKDWFILKDLSAAYFENKEFDKAYNNFIEAAVMQIKIPEPANRWELFYIGAMILYEKNNNSSADEHISLTYKLREDKGWKNPVFLEDLISARNIQMKKTASQLFNELKEFWLREQQGILPMQTGVIKNLIQEGKAGFIEGVDGKSYYFRTSNFLSNKTQLKVNCRVQFNIQKSFDKKRGRDSYEAINIQILQP